MKLWWTPGVARNKKARGHDGNERIEDVVFHMEREGANRHERRVGVFLFLALLSFAVAANAQILRRNRNCGPCAA